MPIPLTAIGVKSARTSFLSVTTDSIELVLRIEISSLTPTACLGDLAYVLSTVLQPAIRPIVLQNLTDYQNLS
jgi:hypothetical protein